jgi:transcription factor CP2-like protein
VFKQEVPSPPNHTTNNVANEMIKTPRSPPNLIQCVRLPNNGIMNGQVQQQQQQQQQQPQSQPHLNDHQQGNGSTSSSTGLANLLEQLEGNNQSSGGSNNNNNQPNNDGHEMRSVHNNDESRFQYVLAAATSIATKSNEETLTYLNQGQSYEIKLKKLGDLSTCRGKIMKSVIKICFHERRLQYMEREQMHIWQSSRPGERILDIDIPLSYGLLHVNQSSLLNTADILWDPMKEVGVYIKVNCISTEFTPKKHGGEKGVPFRFESYLN